MSLATKKLFETYKKELEKKLSAPSSRETDPRFINFVADKTYRVRLLFFLDPNSGRSGPFIEKWIHSYWDAENKKSSWVTCPTSSYLKGKAGFNACPICTNNSKLWADHKKNASLVAKKLYDTFKRRFHGFAMAYVINDPQTPDNNGKVKLFKYGSKIHDFLQSEIFGQGEEAVSDPVGSEAFDLENGYDLIIAVTKNVTSEGTFNQYALKFAREKTSINCDKKKLEEEIAAIGYDKDFYTLSSDEALLKYYQDFVLSSSTDEAGASAAIEEDLGSVEAPVNTKKEEAAPAPTEPTKAATAPNTDEIDVEKLIADLDIG